MKHNEKVTKAVETYVETIVRCIKEYSYTAEVDVDYAEAFNEDNTQESRSAIVTTKLGAVVVMPNFKKKSASATVVNLGTIRQMEMEGFDEEFIEKRVRSMERFYLIQKLMQRYLLITSPIKLVLSLNNS